jgi:multisubunit Na+/H+ antiporter MnhE subunit
MKKLIASLAVLAPSVALAQTTAITDVNSLYYKLQGISNLIIGLLIAFAVVWIIISVVRFIMASGEERAERRSSILWGIVGLAIILSIWGLVAILTNTFAVSNNSITPNNYPTNNANYNVQ